MGVRFDYDFGDAPIVDGIVYLSGEDTPGYTPAAAKHKLEGEDWWIIYCHHCDTWVTYSSHCHTCVKRIAESDAFHVYLYTTIKCNFCGNGIMAGVGQNLDITNRVYESQAQLFKTGVALNNDLSDA